MKVSTVFGKDRPLAVETVAVHGHVAIGEEVGLDDGFEGGFAMSLDDIVAPFASPRKTGAGATYHVVMDCNNRS